MLSIAAIQSAGGTVTYHFQVAEPNTAYASYAADDGGQPAPSAWFGKGAEALGLRGSVQPEALKDILEGHVPGTDRQMGRRLKDGTLQHRPGWDYTFSAPKSVSILALVWGQTKLRQLHQAAVLKTLKRIERDVIQTRVWNPRTGQQELVSNQKAVIATFEHSTSRNLDPQLHTHALIANMVQGEDGKWRSVEAKALYSNKHLMGMLYRLELARGLVALGYELQRHGKGLFEIANLPRGLLKHFSTRAQEIRAHMAKELASPNAKASDQAALQSRQKKQDVDLKNLVSVWRQASLSFGLGPESLEKLKQPLKAFTMTVREAVDHALAHLSERQATFRFSDLFQQAASAGLGGVETSELQGELVRRLRTGELRQGEGPLRFGALLTTRDTQALEQSLLDTAERGRGAAGAPLYPAQALTAQLDRHDQARQPEAVRAATKAAQARDAAEGIQGRVWGRLTQGQRAGIEQVLTSSDRVVGIQGSAGVGKTTLLERTRDLAAKKGWQLMGLAPTATARDEMKHTAGMPASTLQAFLSQYEGLAKGRGTPEGLAKMRRQYRKTLFVLDEASMVSTRQMHAFVTILEKLGCRAVLVGDRRQLDAVDAGKAFAQLQDHKLAHAQVKDIMRQRRAGLLRAVQHAVAGRPDSALQAVAGSIHELGRHKKFGPALSEAYFKYRDQAGMKAGMKVGVMAPTHALRREINDAICNERLKRGELHHKSWTRPILNDLSFTTVEKGLAGNYEADQFIRFSQAHKRLGIQKNELYRIDTVQRNAGALVLSRVDPSRPETYESLSGKQKVIIPSQFGQRSRASFSVFNAEPRTFRANDLIRFTESDRGRGIHKSHQGVVEKITSRGLVVRTEDGRRHRFSHREQILNHIDLGYCSTVHAFQGRTVDYALAAIPAAHRHLTTQKSFYVELSRAREGVHFVTDDKKELQAGLLKRTGERLSALELVKPLNGSTGKTLGGTPLAGKTLGGGSRGAGVSASPLRASGVGSPRARASRPEPERGLGV